MKVDSDKIAHFVFPITGNSKSYYECLDKLSRLAGKKVEQKPRVVFHTDQGAGYSSRAFQYSHKDYDMLRSISRKETLPDNPIIEALNGWMKQELYLVFGLSEAESLPDLPNKYVYFFNNLRPAATFGYKSPVQ